MALPFDFNIALFALTNNRDVMVEDSVLTPLLRELADAALGTEFECQSALGRNPGGDTRFSNNAMPLKSRYPFVWFAAMDYQVEADGHCKSVYIILGLNLEGRKEILGLYILNGDKTDFWISVFTDLNNRGLEDMLISIAAVDESKSFLTGINHVFPQTDVQLCLNHQIRHALGYVAAKDEKAFTATLLSIYNAQSKEAAEAALEELGNRWGDQYPIVIKSWRNKWEHLSVNFKYPVDIRRVVYAANPVETVCRQLTEIAKGREAFPDENSLIDLLYTIVQKA